MCEEFCRKCGRPGAWSIVSFVGGVHAGLCPDCRTELDGAIAKSPEWREHTRMLARLECLKKSSDAFVAVEDSAVMVLNSDLKVREIVLALLPKERPVAPRI